MNFSNLIFLALLFLISCGSESGNDSQTKPVEANKTVTPEPTTPPQLQSQWTLRKYVDDFDDPTNDEYMTTRSEIYGTFGNTATSDSPLRVVITVDDSKDIRFALYEYDRNHRVKSFSKKDYVIRAKNEKGEYHFLSGFMPTDFDRILMNNADSETLHKLFQKSHIVKMNIQEDKRRTTEYKFIINCDGYTETYKKLKKKPY